jgi:putative membrane protein (TIGR04086 family)
VALSDELDLRALYEGFSVAAMIAVPAGVVGRVLSDRDSDFGWLWVLVVVVLVGLVLGSGVAAWRQEKGLPLTHGVLTGVGTFVVVQAIGVTIELIVGDDVNWTRIASSLLLSLMAGTVGGVLGSILLNHGAPPTRR